MQLKCGVTASPPGARPTNCARPLKNKMTLALSQVCRCFKRWYAVCGDLWRSIFRWKSPGCRRL